MTQRRKPMIPHRKAMTALRDIGYKNTTYAIAELIDNSIQAGAKNIELLCCDRVIPVNKRERRTIHQIAVADDGCGMNEQVLENSLQYGSGTRLEDRSGIGRWGVGLLNSSISQGKLLEVYTWKDNKNPLYSYAAVEDDDEDVPVPQQKQIDKHWEKFSECVKRPSGTLVVWSDLDRCRWRKSKTIIDRSEHTIGRIYRNLIASKKIKISAISFTDELEEYEKRDIIINDPCYLIVPSSTPKPYDNEAMFVPDGDGDLIETVTKDGQEHQIRVKFSLAKTKARRGIKKIDAGDEEWGRHAANNVGISLMRSERELELTTALNINDTRERWWGVEISFPPILDEMFGVTNNKQSATNFVELATAVRAKKRSSKEEEEDSDDKELLRIIEKIQKRLNLIRKKIHKQKIDTRSKDRHVKMSEDIGTDAIKKRQKEGHVGASDKGEEGTPEERVAGLTKVLEKQMPKEEAVLEAKNIIAKNSKCKIMASPLSGSMLFDIERNNGVVIVKINQNHPAYNNLIEVVRDVPDSTNDIEELKNRLQRANNGLELLLLSWSRFEDEETDMDKLREMQDIRMEWGKFIAEFLEQNK